MTSKGESCYYFKKPRDNVVRDYLIRAPYVTANSCEASCLDKSVKLVEVNNNVPNALNFRA